MHHRLSHSLLLLLGRRGLPWFLGFLGMAASLPVSAQALAFPDFAELVERVAPAVVNIRTNESGADAPRSPFRRPAPGPSPGDEPPRGEGSGFIISADGYVMTNAHVLEGAQEVLVTLVDRREFKATVVGADERSDIAVLKIDGKALPVARIGDVGRLRVGEWVLAIGSPFGLESTVTAGIVSAKQRETGSDIALLQTDVAVNPGNSGGPLINTRGEVVGINSQILSPVGSYIGISFAIPIDEAMRIAQQLRQSGRVVRGYLGIQPTDVPRELAQEYGLTSGRSRTRGAFVRQVIPGGPGERAGVQPGDVILSVNGRAMEGAVDLRRTLGAIAPGTEVTLQLNRRGKPLELKASLADLGQQVVAGDRVPPPPAEQAVSGVAQGWGLMVAGLSAAERQGLGGVGGVKVAGVSAAAEAVGLKVGDVILAVGGGEVDSLREFETRVSAQDKARPLAVMVRRGGVALFVSVPPGN